MKVLHVISSISKTKGGPSYAVIAMVKALRTKGIDAEILTTNDDGAGCLDVPLGVRTLYEEVPVWFLPRSNFSFKDFVFSTALKKWLSNNIDTYDIIHNHYLFTHASSCSASLARKFGKPYFMRPVGQLTPSALLQSPIRKRVYSFLFEKRNLRKAAAVHCTSSNEEKNVKEFGIHSPTFVLPLGVDIPDPIPNARSQIYEELGISDETPIILFLGRLHYYKRPDLLIQALGHIAKKNIDFRCILAGSGEKSYLKELHELVKSEGVESHISFVGHVSGVKKDLLFQGSDIFVMPSFSENFGLAIAESMAAELPVIVSEGAQLFSTIIDWNAGLVFKGEIDGLIAAIEELVSSKKLRKELGKNGKRLVRENYSWSKTSAEIVEDIYKPSLQGELIH